MSERITLVACPQCGQAAAAGWKGRGLLVEFDCSAGCLLTPAQLRRLETGAQSSGKEVIEACDAQACGWLATQPAPGWPGFWVCSVHAEALRRGVVPAFVSDHSQGWRHPRLVLPRGE